VDDRGIPSLGDAWQHALVHPAAGEQPVQAEHWSAARFGDVDRVETE
jgi:hypothetical protein